ncbi:flagellar hook-basal body complex protein FliE [Blastococcus xanthinilyticus]|uniref:Flagellar hook-basal body complex protein FliE n=1 Tax=Blastococcus xanthinilyticus TaxID=1564164 RepID=A0A5S5CVE7_9ACTN|nr:flagellar hook-basal body complex protein FliE [Blastococcus xanthinilyticus]TYP86299.1 flagellar hook-basal body complex protein FliE [Blastococcus xanthinilyticus]
MTAPLGGIPPVGMGAVTGVAGSTRGTPATEGADGFAAVLAASFDKLQATQNVTAELGVQAATGDLKDVHDYMIASAESGVATEMVVTIKNQAVAAFTEIMRMQI